MRILVKRYCPKVPAGYTIDYGTVFGAYELLCEVFEDLSFQTWLDRFKGDGHLFVASDDDDGEIVACAGCTKLADDTHWLQWVAVHPDHRNRGLGRAVCERAIAKLIGDGATTIYVNHEPDSAAGRALYELLGFEPAGKFREVQT